MDLTTTRPIGMAAGPIPWTATQRYAEAHGMNTHETYALHQVIRHMDDTWLGHQQDRSAEMQHKPAASRSSRAQSPRRR